MTNRETQSLPAFITLCVVTLIAAAAMLAGSYKWWSTLPQTQASYFRRIAQTTSADQKLILSRFATWFDHDNPQAHIDIAAASLALHEGARGLRELQLVNPTPASQLLKSQLLLEDGQANAAAELLNQLITDPQTDENTLVLACLANASAGQAPACQSVAARVSSPEATTSVLRAQGDTTTLAAALYAKGLLLSSQRALANEPITPTRNLLLARINYDLHTEASLQQARDLLTIVLKLNPIDLEARQLLVATYQDLGDTPNAVVQTDLVNKLLAGRP
jgi:hypothetical protein